MKNLEEGVRFPAEAGLNLFAVLDVPALPDRTKGLIEGSGVPLSEYRHLRETSAKPWIFLRRSLPGTPGLPPVPPAPLQPRADPVPLPPFTGNPAYLVRMIPALSERLLDLFHFGPEDHHDPKIKRRLQRTRQA